jgi:hypothetical protein
MSCFVCFGSAQDGDPNKPADAKMGGAPPDRVVSRVGSGEGARQLDLGIASRFACVLLFLLLFFFFVANCGRFMVLVSYQGACDCAKPRSL